MPHRSLGQAFARVLQAHKDSREAQLCNRSNITFLPHTYSRSAQVYIPSYTLLPFVHLTPTPAPSLWSSSVRMYIQAWFRRHRAQFPSAGHKCQLSAFSHIQWKPSQCGTHRKKERGGGNNIISSWCWRMSAALEDSSTGRLSSTPFCPFSHSTTGMPHPVCCVFYLLLWRLAPTQL